MVDPLLAAVALVGSVISRGPEEEEDTFLSSTIWNEDGSTAHVEVRTQAIHPHHSLLCGGASEGLLAITGTAGRLRPRPD